MRQRKSCGSSSGVGTLKLVTVAALRVDAAEDVLDRAVLSAAVHRLENDQHCVLPLGVEQFLKLVELLEVLRRRRRGGILVFERSGVVGATLRKLELAAGLDEVWGVDHLFR